MIHIEPYRDEFKDKIPEFIALVFPETNRHFQPEGRHACYLDVPGHFFAFFCLFDDERLIGTSALR